MGSILVRVCAVFAATVLAYGASTRGQQPSVSVINVRTGQAGAGSAVELLPAAEFDRIPTFYSVQSSRDGTVAGTATVVGTGETAEALVYLEDVGDPRFGVFTAFFRNFQPSTGLLFPGTMIADNLGLEGGLPLGGTISSYTAQLFRSSLDPNPGELADFHIELWDGDPFGMVDTPGGGFAGAPIAGTGVDFVDVPAALLAHFNSGPLPQGVTLTNPDLRVWMVVSGSRTANRSPCRLGWVIGKAKPRIGNDAPGDIFAGQWDADALTLGGTCCMDGVTCNVGTGPCPGDTATGSRGFCSDGDAEVGGIFFFGGPCGGGPGDFCANFVASVFSPAQTTITLQPVGNEPDGTLVAGASIVGHEIRTERGGEKVVFEIRLGDWDAIDNLCVGGAVEGNSCNDDADCPNCLNPLDPDCAESQCGVSLRAYQVNIDSSGYTSGLQGALTPHLEPCLTSADCTVTMGGHCSITGDFCVTTEMCPLSDAPFFEVCAPGTSCEFRVRDRAGTFCAPGFIDKDRGGPNGFVFPDPLIAVDLTTKNYRFGAATAGDSVHDPDPFPPGGLYGGVLVLDVSANAKGTFTINMIPPGVGGSGMLDQNNQDIALLGLVPGRVTVEVGRCCFDLAGAGGCVDSVTRDECEGQPGPSTFAPGARCADGCCDCLTDVDCDDGSACTVDECGGATGCSCIRTPAFDEATQCCDPVTGTVEPLDDGSPCTLLGTCDPLTGEVTRPPASAGILCNDQEACTDNDRCDGAGTCAGDANIAGRACSSDDQCSGGSCFEGTCFCPAVVACCLSDGRCEPLPESNCEGRGGRRAAACLGDADGNGRDDACDQAVIPAVSGWGVAVMVCLLLAGGKHFFGRRITRGCRETFG